MLNDSFKFSYKSSLRENLFLTVYNTGFQQCEAGYQWGPALRDHYLIHYITTGKGYYRLNGATYPLTSGDLFIVFESSVISYQADQEEPWEYYWVGFNGTEAKRLLQMTAFSRENPVLHIGDHSDEVKRLLLNIYNSRGTNPSSEVQMCGHLLLFLSKLIELNTDGHHASHTSSVYVDQALQFIQYNYSHKIDVTEIAKSIGVSRSHLYRIFIENLSISPNEYLIRFRINEACSLLHNSALSIGQIANSVGFDDALYFSRVFKKIKKVSPSQYLKHLKDT